MLIAELIENWNEFAAEFIVFNIVYDLSEVTGNINNTEILFLLVLSYTVNVSYCSAMTNWPHTSGHRITEISPVKTWNKLKGKNQLAQWNVEIY